MLLATGLSPYGSGIEDYKSEKLIFSYLSWWDQLVKLNYLN
jgi:hypothetical protein